MKTIYLFGGDGSNKEVKEHYDNNVVTSYLVCADDYYTEDKGYGFITESVHKADKNLQLPELNSGFEPTSWYQENDITKLQNTEYGVCCDSVSLVLELKVDERRRIPLIFKAVVLEQGNYEVTVSIKNMENQPAEYMIFLGRRRLVSKIWLSGGEQFTKRFLANVTDIIPRGNIDRKSDLTIDVSIVGRKSCLSRLEIEPSNVPTLYVLGDSTVTDQSAEYPYAPETSYCGWGQMLTAYLSKDIAISNHAHSGLTVESFRSEGHLAIVYDYIKTGDACLIQFGHNDQKRQHLKAEEGYLERILELIRELKEKGVIPILVTPMARNSWKGSDGSYNDLLDEYAKVCLRIGKEEQIPVIDLHEKSMEFIMSHGVNCSKPYFYPNDYTHSNDVGAYLMAGFVAAELQNKAPEWIARAIHIYGCGLWEPKEVEPASVPKQLKDKWELKVEHELFCDLKRPEEPCSRAECLEMIIQAARFFPTNVYNDMFLDVLGHEWYAGTIQCAYQNGILEESMKVNGCIRPQEPVTMQEAIAFAINGYKSRKGEAPDTVISSFVKEEELSALIVSRSRVAKLCKDMKL